MRRLLDQLTTKTWVWVYDQSLLLWRSDSIAEHDGYRVIDIYFVAITGIPSIEHSALYLPMAGLVGLSTSCSEHAWFGGNS
jgi:hypothetical protein